MDITPIVSLIANVLALAVFIAATSLPILALIAIALGRRVQWDFVLLIMILLYALAPMIRSFGPSMIDAVNDSWENSVPGMDRFEANMVTYYQTRTAAEPGLTPTPTLPQIVPPTIALPDATQPPIATATVAATPTAIVIEVPTMTPNIHLAPIEAFVPTPTIQATFDPGSWNYLTPAPTPNQ